MFVLPPLLHPNLFQGLLPSLLISPLSLSAVVPCVQLTFSPNIPPPLPLFVWNCYANVETAASFFYLFSSPSGFLSAGLEVEGGRGGGWCEGRPSNSTSPPPPNQIGSLDLLYMSLFFPPLQFITLPSVGGKDISNKVCVNLDFFLFFSVVFLNSSAFYRVLVCALFDHVRARVYECVCV